MVEHWRDNPSKKLNYRAGTRETCWVSSVFYQAFPMNKFHFKNVFGGNRGKIFLTDQTAAKMTVEKLPMFAIRKSEKIGILKDAK